MIFSVKTNKETENGQVVFHFAFDQFWFEDAKWNLGDVAKDFIEEVMTFHITTGYTFNEEQQVYEINR